MFTRALFYITIASLLMIPCTSAFAARDLTQVHLEPGTGLWSLGMAFRNGTFPYVGKDDVDDLLPLITYSGETFFIDGTRTGFHLYQSSDWLIGAYAAYRFAGFNEEDGIERDDIDRDDGVDGRFDLTRLTNFGSFILDFGHDISGASNGGSNVNTLYVHNNVMGS